ncbi:hypothetical protein [Buchnera aphidicola]|uniref:hypothetical protein n=1 Tax=Buchnera aphidicola TaxID=9 RepID=UPI0011D0E1C7|nr:hypothetical protein [Buchnera aphidicola]
MLYTGYCYHYGLSMVRYSKRFWNRRQVLKPKSLILVGEEIIQQYGKNLVIRNFGILYIHAEII